MLVFPFRVHNHFSSLCPYQLCFSCVCAFVTTNLFIDFQPFSNICEVWFYLWLYTKLAGRRRQADSPLTPETCRWGLPGDTGREVSHDRCDNLQKRELLSLDQPGNLQSPPGPALLGGAGPWCSLLSEICKSGNSAVRSGSRQLPVLQLVLKMLE